MSKVEIKKVKIKRNDTEEIKELKKDAVFPIQKNKLLAIILKENKSSSWKWVDYDEGHFKVGSHTYFKSPDGTYLSDNKVLISVYIEGISIPISHTYIEKQEVEREYVAPDGSVTKMKINLIKGMKFDSEIADMLLNRHLSDEFMKNPADKGIIALLILIVISLIFGIVNLVGQFVIK